MAELTDTQKKTVSKKKEYELTDKEKELIKAAGQIAGAKRAAQLEVPQTPEELEASDKKKAEERLAQLAPERDASPSKLQEARNTFSGMSLFPQAEEGDPKPAGALLSSMEDAQIGLRAEAKGFPESPVIDPKEKSEFFKGIYRTPKGESGDQSAFDEKSTMRQDFFNELKSLSKKHPNDPSRLTPEIYAKAKEQLGKYEGVSGEAFEATMKKNSIKPSNFTTAAPTSSSKEAAQNVIFQRQYGTGLGALAAMQDPNYKIGSGSPLRQPSRAIGPKSGKARRASRRLRRQGYGRAAEQMAMAGEMVRANEPSIDTPALRAGRLLGKIDASKEIAKQEEERKKQADIAAGSKNIVDAMGVGEPKSNDSIQQPKKVGKYQSPLDKTRNQNPEKPKAFEKYQSPLDKTRNQNPKEAQPTSIDPSQFLYDLKGNAISLDEVRKRGQGPVYYDKDGNEMMVSEYQTAEFRDSNGNGIEDRSEGIYRKSDYVKKPKGPRPRGL